VSGEFVPLGEARVSLNDRAFYFADAVYEVVATFGGKIFLLDYHFDRLENSLRGVRIPYAVDRKALEALFYEGIRRAGYEETLVYMQVSRGAALREKRFPEAAACCVVLTFRPKPPVNWARLERGISLLLVPDDRWGHCDYKTIMLLPNVLASQRAVDAGKDDAVFYDAEKKVIREATSANIFIVKNSRYITPNLDNRILPGTVRRYLIEEARRQGLAVEERPVAVQDLIDADEAFLTGTTTEVLAVVSVDGRPIGKGKPGPMTRQLHRIYDEAVGRKPADRMAKV
jgi:D-alanine transaminase